MEYILDSSPIIIKMQSIKSEVTKFPHEDNNLPTYHILDYAVSLVMGTVTKE